MISGDQIAMEFYDEGSDIQPQTFAEEARSKLTSKKCAIPFILVLLIIMISSLIIGLQEKEITDSFDFLGDDHDPPPFYHTAFIFELNRHGARAPYWDDPIAMKDFPSSVEMLSPQGMRQRMLLGATMKKLIKEPLDFYVESTDVYRTI